MIIEDDYDAEYRYDRPGLGAIQAMAPDRVVYLGTVSKTLVPALRVGWMVAPSRVRNAVVERKRLSGRGCGTLLQAGFGELLHSGGYDRHLRRTRNLYRRRRDTLIEALTTHLPEWKPIGIAAGLHVVLMLPPGIRDAIVARELAARDIRVFPLSSYTYTTSIDPGLVLGWAGLSPDRIRTAIAAVADAYDALDLPLAAGIAN